ncbi:hypothetical protein BDZ97DRAFT_1911875 [Flammula alnicola]|nr:hypothetical protein BDZ97DRAFT_1911875 [Flammula alnicola]
MSSLQNSNTVPNAGASAESVPSPGVVKKVEKEVKKEAKHEEKSVKGVLKDLSKPRKRKAKHKSTLSKAQKKEQDALKEMYKAEQKHDIAVSNLRKAQQDLDLSTQSHGHLKETVQAKGARVEEAMKEQEEHTKVRNAKLNALHGPSAINETGRIIPESEATPSAAPGIFQN